MKKIILYLAGIPVLLAAAPKRPNLLIAIADDWSYPHAGAYGNSWVKTPAFDRVAREGVLFANTYTPVAKCSASRACLLTGRAPWTIESGFTHYGFFPTAFRSYAEALATAGYFTGYTGKGWAPGIAQRDGKPRALLGRNFSQIKATPPTTGISAVDYAANFTAFLNAVPKDKPWCFWYGGLEPHRPYEFQSGVAKDGKHLGDVDRVPGYWPDNEDVRHDMLDYAFEVEHFDRHLARILAELEKRGELDNTLVVVTGDNGMPFPRSKGQTYEISSHLPLAIRWPATVAKPGRTVADYVSFTDIAPTLFDAAGVVPADAGMSPMTGRSLRPLLASDRSGRIDPARDHVLLGRERHDPGRPRNEGYPIRAIVKEGWLFLHNYATDRWPSGNPETGYLDVDASPTKSTILAARRANGHDHFWDLAFGLRGADELYDLAHDPDCLTNLAAAPGQVARVAALRQQLRTELTAQGDPRQRGDDAYFDKFLFSNDELNDFYECWQRHEVPIPNWVSPSDVEPAPLK